MPAETVVRMKRLTGTWEVSGRDRFPGVIPESVQYDFNDWGPDTASFVLKRRPGDVQPDLLAFSDVEIEIGGVKVWDGRIKDTPGRSGGETQTNVQCEGMQYHLDDDVFERTYVHTTLSDWVDRRSILTTTLGASSVSADFSVSNEAGLTIGIADGIVVALAAKGGVVLDMGEGDTCARLTYAGTSSFNNNSGSPLLGVLISGSDDPAGENNVETIVAFTALTTIGATFGPLSASFSTPKRYVLINLMASAVNSPGTISGDCWIRFSILRAYRSTSYETSHASNLKSSTVVRDTLAATSPLISNKGVVDSTFSLPELDIAEPRTGREIIAAVDAYEDRIKQVSLERDFVYKAKPTVAKLVDGPTSVYDDLSGATTEDAFNRVIVTGEGPAGETIRVTRWAANQIGVPLLPVTSPALVNPSFATDISGWTENDFSLQGVFTRDTTVFDSSPASGRFRFAPGVPSAGDHLLGSTTGTFEQGSLYVLSYMIRMTVPHAMMTVFGVAGDSTTSLFMPPLANTWYNWSIVWSPKADTSSALVKIEYRLAGTAQHDLNIDTFQIQQAAPTLPDRRGIVKTRVLPIESRITTDVGARFGDLALTEALRTPTRGSLTAPAGGLRLLATDEAIPPAQFGYYIGELVRLRGEIDPDTGGVGRDVRLIGGAYSGATGQASLRLDSQRGNFQALLNRLAVVTGNTAAPTV